VRALGVGLPYAVAVSLFGGSAEYVALFLKGRGVETSVYWYVTATIFCSLLVYVFMRDTRDRTLIKAE
jgi:MHS family alpha-ketoglutarate permease-like MFS transporter